MESLSKDLGFDAKVRRLRCAGHIINLIAKQLLCGTDTDVGNDADGELGAFRGKGPIHKIHNLAIWIYRSSQRKARFQKAKEEAQLSTKLELRRDVKTRWNSTYTMITRACQLKVAINNFFDDEIIANRRHMDTLDHTSRAIISNGLSNDDWNMLGEYAELLEPLAEATIILQGNPGQDESALEKKSLAAYVLLAFEFLLNHLKTKKEELSRRPGRRRPGHLIKNVELAWRKCNEYYQKLDDTPVYLAGLVLHPSHKWHMIDQLWGENSVTKSLITPAKAKVKNFWEEQYKNQPGPSRAVLGKKGKTKFDAFIQSRAGKSSASTVAPSPDSGDEYEEWLQMPTIEVSSALQYWIDNRKTWPRLARMGIDLFTIPAMSAEPERVFSMAGSMVTTQRNSLNPDSIQACQCLRSWDSAKILPGQNLFEPGTVETDDLLAGMMGSLGLGDGNLDRDDTLEEDVSL